METLRKEDIDDLIDSICKKLKGVWLKDIALTEEQLLSKSLYTSIGFNVEELEKNMIFSLTVGLPVGENDKFLEIYSFGVEKEVIHPDTNFEDKWYKLYLRAEWV